MYWYLYATPTGYSCVVASPDRYEGRNEDEDEDDEDEDFDDERSGEGWFCAPSFEAFIYRAWIENEIWFRLEEPTSESNDPRSLRAEMQAYLDHYRRPKPKRKKRGV